MAGKYSLLTASLVIFLTTCSAKNHCSEDDVIGTWVFYEGPRTGNRDIDCMGNNSMKRYANATRLILSYPDEAVDQYGNEGKWTLVYSAGFEVTVNERIYFGVFYVDEDSDVINCGKLVDGVSHDVTVRNWACFYGRKRGGHTYERNVNLTSTWDKHQEQLDDLKLIRKINSVQNSWVAEMPNEGNMTLQEMINTYGGIMSTYPLPEPAPATPEMKMKAKRLPKRFDWRNVSGVNYVSPVRNQGDCRSCYAFASMASVESRLRIKTKNKLQVILSPQDVVSCSMYNKGCEGGLPYLAAGRYGQEYGFVEESEFPYVAKEVLCRTHPNARRHYVAHYQYVGGYYGGCSEEAMRVNLVEKGPLIVSFNADGLFVAYKRGIYHHVEFNERHHDPYQKITHCVVLVGYGVHRKTGEKYWIGKNSWGKNWGEKGYFKIRRGNNERGIEALALDVMPIP